MSFYRTTGTFANSEDSGGFNEKTATEEELTYLRLSSIGEGSAYSLKATRIISHALVRCIHSGYQPEMVYAYWDAKKGGREGATQFDLYHVFAILDHGSMSDHSRRRAKKLVYKIQWVGYNGKDHSWEPAAKIAGLVPQMKEDHMPSITVYRGTPSGRVQEGTVPPRGPPKVHQVTVRITHSGLCGTDEYYKCQDMVLGHEGRQLYGFDEFNQGSFATYATWNEQFLFRIPESIPSAEAAPLMCAGAAVYSALRSSGVQWYHRVDVLGLGGLGHLAVQYAAKMGCHVTVCSHSSGKEEAARNLGASEFQVMGDTSPSSRAVDCLLLTGAQEPDWFQALSLVRRGGVISAINVDSSELRCSYGDILMNATRIQGSLPAAPNVQREMLSFSALHEIKSIIETFPFTEGGIDEAMEKLRQGKMRYRGVLAMDV
ncbi:hypothetical protein LZL87_009876 [Fusarium oxysporum]|nr:hypothetical protein LZL87_009876 [Fusarium oxysporum]